VRSWQLLSEKKGSSHILQTASIEQTISYFSRKPTMTEQQQMIAPLTPFSRKQTMTEQQQMIAPLTPLPRRKVESIDSMISQIDTERRLRREGEKRSHLKRADHTPPSLVDESHQTAKRRCVSLDFSVVSDDESEEISKISFRQHWSRAPPRMIEGPSCTLRPRNLNRELSTCEGFEGEVRRITDDLPFMPF
jgi:hypothetical protein